MIKRIYAEKRLGYDIEAQHLLADLQTNLGITGLKSLRLFVRYDCEGMELDEYERAKNTIFHEPPIDHLYEENIPDIDGSTLIATQLLPGQYNQQADFTMQALRLLNPSSQARIITGKLLALTGKLTPEDIEKIKEYYINPVEAEEVSIEKPATLESLIPQPDDVEIIEDFGPDSIAELGLAMSAADAEFCAEYFANEENRPPTLTEIRVLDTYWSDHCRHTTFLTELENIEIQPDYIQNAYDHYLRTKAPNKPACLMGIATLPAKHLAQQGLLPELDISEEINACSIEIPVDVKRTQKRKTYSSSPKPEKFLLMFKNETHNHPTEIEPFGGAATCLGGAIRDPLSGRAHVYQSMRVTGSGDPRQKIADTLAGKLPQRKITTTAAAGFSSYGNQIGLATGQVAEIYHDGYIAKRLECGALIAATPKDNVVRQTPAPTDVVILLGGKTGRDGCGGATGSSKTHDFDTTATAGAEVQKGNAPGQRGIVRLFRNPKVSRLIKRCNDFGAGGVSVAIGELADGLTINLDRVPKKYDGLDGTELAISESQERMAVVVAAEHAETFMQYADSENLESTIVAEVTEEPRLVMYWRGQKIVDMHRTFLNSNGAPRKASASISTPSVLSYFTNPPIADFKSKLTSLNFCSQKGLVERFDSTIGTGTILLPFGGKNQLTPPNCMVAKIPVENGETSTCSFMSYAYCPELSSTSPFHGAAYAVLESIAKIVASGGDWRTTYLTFQEFFERLGDEPARWGKPLAALLGAYHAQISLGRAAIGGKDSMSGSYITDEGRIDVPPTLISFAVGYGNAEHVVSPEFKRTAHDLLLVETPRDANGLPDWEAAKENFDAIHELIKDQRVYSASALGSHGLFSAIVQCFGNDVGVQIDGAENLYTPRIGDILLEVASCKSITLGRVIGNTTCESTFSHGTQNIELEQAKKLWSKPLADVFPLEKTTTAPFVEYHAPRIIQSKASFASPRVFIPVFPGTNCEYDSSRAFALAGGTPEVVVMQNRTASHIEQTIEKMAKTIDNSQIIMLPGGFSASDEPDGSAKYIVALLRNPRIAESIMNLLDNRDGLILGICNGFQALIKSGLLPLGRITEMTIGSPTLTYNTIGRHISKMVTTRICSNLSPWLKNMRPGEEHIIPISHGEGRLVAHKAVLKELQKTGQIATQYVEIPNGSDWGVEGITSPDGRIFGKMAHSERTIGEHLAKNIPNAELRSQNIFKNGVEYYA